jgi:uncharacterized membrane protein YidH (DUF202 family)
VSVADAGDRTVLAWRRSGLSLVACGLAMVRGIGYVRQPRQPVAGGIVIGLGLAVWMLYVWIARRRSRVELGALPRPARLDDLAPVAVSTAFLGVACLVIELLA